MGKETNTILNYTKLNCIVNNSALGRHWICRRVRIVAPIPKRTEREERKKRRRKKSCVTCRVSRVTCHLSLTPTATAIDPPPTNSPIMQSQLVPRDTKPKQISKHKIHQNNKNTKMSRGMPILAIHSLTRSLQSTRKWGFCNGARHTDKRLTDIAT